jgi:hypothetical protein
MRADIPLGRKESMHASMAAIRLASHPASQLFGYPPPMGAAYVSTGAKRAVHKHLLKPFG